MSIHNKQPDFNSDTCFHQINHLTEVIVKMSILISFAKDLQFIYLCGKLNNMDHSNDKRNSFLPHNYNIVIRRSKRTYLDKVNTADKPN